MKLTLKVKPPKIGEKVSLNGFKCVVVDIRPITGYLPKRWVIEVQALRGGKK